jgi:hypothetical protein
MATRVPYILTHRKYDAGRSQLSIAANIAIEMKHYSACQDGNKLPDNQNPRISAGDIQASRSTSKYCKDV